MSDELEAEWHIGMMRVITKAWPEESRGSLRSLCVLALHICSESAAMNLSHSLEIGSLSHGVLVTPRSILLYEA